MFKSLSRVHIATVSSVLAVLAILVVVFAFNEPSSARKSKPEASISESIPTLTFGVYTSDKPSEMFKKFKPMLRYIEDEIAARIEDSPRSSSSSTRPTSWRSKPSSTARSTSSGSVRLPT